jgi:hypothetical protein
VPGAAQAYEKDDGPEQAKPIFFVLALFATTASKKDMPAFQEKRRTVFQHR